MTYFGLDSETALIQPGLLAPPPVVFTWCDGERADLIPSSDGWRHQEEWLGDTLPTAHVVGFNIAFDFGVVLAWFPRLTDHVFKAYDEGRVHEIEMAERLGEIATGYSDKHTSLARLASLYGVAQLDKENSPRLDYARFLFKSELPEEHRRYAIEDAVASHRVYHCVRSRYGDLINDDAIAKCSRTMLWLHLCSAWGLRVAPDRLEDLKQATLARQANLLAVAQSAGFVRANGSKDTTRLKQYVCQAYGVPWRYVAKRSNKRTTWLTWEHGELPTAIRTDGKKPTVSTNRVVLLDSGDPTLEAFSEWGQVSSTIAKDLPMLEDGTVAPIHTKFRMADTTRTTSSKGAVAGGNLQNFGREGGTRECLEPRAGYCYGEADVSGLETGTMAQVLVWTIGARAMAERVNEGIDFHSATGAEMLRTTYDAFRKAYKEADALMAQGLDVPAELQRYVDARQVCKPANFGYQGGMAAETFIHFARAQYGFKLTLQDAEDLKKAWANANPDIARGYLNGYIRTLKNANGLYDFTIPGSPGITRHNVPYCSCANGHFQGLGAQVMTQAGWELMHEAWTDRASPLHVDFGARMASFVHDSFFYEIPIGLQHVVMMRVKEIMLRVLTRELPDVKMKVDPVAMDRWSKKAGKVYNEKGELQIWHAKQ